MGADSLKLPAHARQREFPFSDADFAAMRRLVKQVTGINLAESKRELVYGRLSRRLRALGLSSFGEYRAMLERGGEQEMVAFCNAITTNLTAFFREPHHFEHLREHLRRLRDQGQRRIRIWSAGCSTGEEPYSIAMTVLEAIPDAHRLDIRILATDLDSDVLGHGKRGIYRAERVKSVGPRRTSAFFVAEDGGADPTFSVKAEVASLITFKQLNLMQDWPMKGPFDVIFCRNVVIYFDKDTQRTLFAAMSKLQMPGAMLYLGHSESLFRVCEDYELLGKTMYRRLGS